MVIFLQIANPPQDLPPLHFPAPVSLTRPNSQHALRSEIQNVTLEKMFYITRELYDFASI